MGESPPYRSILTLQLSAVDGGRLAAARAGRQSAAVEARVVGLRILDVQTAVVVGREAAVGEPLVRVVRPRVLLGGGHQRPATLLQVGRDARHHGRVARQHQEVSCHPTLNTFIHVFAFV